MPYKISLLLVGVRNKAQLEGILVMYINIRHKMDRVRAFSSYTLYFLFYSVSREIWEGGRARCNIRSCGRSWWIHVKERREKKGGPKRESSNEDAVFKKTPCCFGRIPPWKKIRKLSHTDRGAFLHICILKEIYDVNQTNECRGKEVRLGTQL